MRALAILPLVALLGCTTLVTPSTGATSKTALSSIILLDREGKVIWQMPQ
jgi:hypothetical protein